MASIASVVTRGFGTGIATIALVITAGYGISDAASLPDSITASLTPLLDVRTLGAVLDNRTTWPFLDRRTTEDV